MEERSAPLGGNYFLSNWEADRRYHNGIITVKFGPFLDTGKITDESSALGSHEWLWDLGAQAKVRFWSGNCFFLWQGLAVRQQRVLRLDAVEVSLGSRRSNLQ